MTDHKPLVGLFNPEKSISQHISPRMLRWSLKLGAYQYETKFREGKHHQNADALSRLPLNDVKLQIPEIPEILYCNEAEEQFLITANDIAQATRRNTVLSKVLWHIQRKDTVLSYKSIQFKPFVNKIQVLSVNAQCLLWGAKVIIPAILHPRILDMLHEVHQGMSVIKAVARIYFWWPGLYEDIEMLTRRCEKCACNKKNPPIAASKPWPATLRPWLHIDYAGPFMGTNFFIVVDAHSKWEEVKITSTINAIRTIKLMREIFATHGIPDTIVSDNGRTFVSEEFEKYLKLSVLTVEVRICSEYGPKDGEA
ncbi:uncharacterized protein K02A2.6-like [Teleopsis dalmanni]|uniref:uncharacterized protein K02A2.6-like n=1 Tax=Teleopsis dalmanni TaxID=139649 RepID=UPI0018CC80B3|nr:uncharacterized protein K02A2.6-like [Teleopsis dalmanni]